MLYRFTALSILLLTVDAQFGPSLQFTSYSQVGCDAENQVCQETFDVGHCVVPQNKLTVHGDFADDFVGSLNITQTAQGQATYEVSFYTSSNCSELLDGPYTVTAMGTSCQNGIFYSCSGVDVLQQQISTGTFKRARMAPSKHTALRQKSKIRVK